MNNDHYMNSINVNLISEDATRDISDTDKIFHLSDIVHQHPNSHFLIALSNFSMPYTFYDISDYRGNNTFSISFYDGVSTETANITIDDGNYNTSTLIDEINTQLTVFLATSSLSTLYITENQNQSTFSFVLSPARETVTFSNITLYKILGFPSVDDYVYSTEVTTCVLPYTYFLCGDQTFYVRVANKSLDNVNSRNVSGIVCSIDNDYMHGEIIYYKTNTLHFFKFEGSLETLHVQVLNQEMQDIGPLNTSASFHMSFVVKYAYNKPETNLIKQIFNDNKNINKN